LKDGSNELQIGDEPIRLLYIQPSALNSDQHLEVLDFHSLAETLRLCYPDSELMIRFSSSLETWAGD